MKQIVCITCFQGEEYDALAAKFSGAVVNRAHTLEDVEALATENSVLFSFGSGLIIPKRVLNLFSAAYNIHPASPEFPGRDPHHHAIYRGAEEYGATLHKMEPAVDAGDIIDTDLFTVLSNHGFDTLLSLANAAGMRLVEQYGPAIALGTPLQASGTLWGKTKTMRSDLEELCRIDRFIGPEDMNWKYKAFDGEEHDNLNTTIFGNTFRIDKKNTESGQSEFDWSMFTEVGYRSILKLLTDGGYSFTTYHETPETRHVIWRHDVDYSLQRALWCAHAEAEIGVTATYFVNPRCTFYNLCEPESLRCIAMINELGHEVALHFDSGALGIAQWTGPALDTALKEECDLLTHLTGIHVKSVSWHNPDLSNLLEFDADTIIGLVNAYGKTLRSQYTYCSDSNGYWRFKPMPDVISEGHEKLYLLTHPAWWTPLPMSPRSRIERAVAGRAAAVFSEYDETLASGGRLNIR